MAKVHKILLEKFTWLSSGSRHRRCVGRTGTGRSEVKLCQTNKWNQFLKVMKGFLAERKLFLKFILLNFKGVTPSAGFPASRGGQAHPFNQVRRGLPDFGDGGTVPKGQRVILRLFFALCFKPKEKALNIKGIS